MVKFETVNKLHFINYKSSVIKHFNNGISISSRNNDMNTIIIVDNIEPITGKYMINLKLNTQYRLYWYGTYEYASKIFLENGNNIFYVDIDEKQSVPFVIEIYATNLPIGKSFYIYDIIISKIDKKLSENGINNDTNNFIILDQQNTALQRKYININPTTNIKKYNQQQISNKKITSKQSIYLKSHTINNLYTKPKSNGKIIMGDNHIITTREKFANGKKNILLVIDVKNWCFDNISQVFKKYYENDFNIFIECCLNNPNYSDIYNGIVFDLIIKFWYGYDKNDPFDIYPYAKKAVCIYDYIHWNKKISKNINTNIFKKFTKNINDTEYILYSCPIIKDLLVDQYNEIITNKIMYPIYDGVDIDKFYYKEYVKHDKLVVGWVGNIYNVYKRFSIIKKILKNIDWIDFVVQDKTNFIPHDEMVYFYHNVDVIVCLSESEGTPNPILESSACGRTWVSTNVGIVELLYNLGNDDVRPGIIIDDINKLLSSLEYLYQNKNIMYQMGKMARDCVEKEFSWNIRIKAFDSVLDSLKSNNTVNEIDTDNKINILPKKIIITSTQYPRYGGAATCAYEMHKYLLNQNISSVCIFFDNNIKNNNLLNPDNLLNVYNEKCSDNYHILCKMDYNNIIKIIHDIHGEEPYLIYAFNYLAPIISRCIFKKSKIFYMTTGCTYINNDNLLDSTTFINKPINVYDKDAVEIMTIRLSDVVVPNSQLTKNIFEHCYKNQFANIIDLHEIFNTDGAEPENINREYDIVFVCSDYRRKVKNINFLKEIYQDKLLLKYNKICVGKNSQQCMECDSVYNIAYQDFMTQKQVTTVLNNSKIILITSLIETYCVTAVEASQCGCIVLMSKNTACAAMIDSFFVLDTYNVDEWADKIDTILNNYQYFKKIFKNNYCQSLPIENLWNDRGKNNNSDKINIICCSIDIPYIGGAATNLYRIIKSLSTEKKFNIYGIFISNTDGNYNPDNLENVFKISYNNNTELNLISIKNEINKQVNYIDFIFCKNYKIFPFFKKIFRDTKIIFSPSGLRNISNIAENNYIMDIDINTISNSNIKSIDIDDIYQFIQENDINLDDYAIKQSDMVIPNSLLSYNIINQIYPNIPNLYYPIYITNIVCDEFINDDFINDDFNSRPYDILFCAYNWKRKCKNYEMVLDIANHEDLKNYKIIIIGKAQTKKYNDNIISYDYLENDKFLQLLKTVKSVVIPSKYDSNPNVLMEAITSGCNVITSKNVGNSENLNKICIVNDYKNTDSWVITIQECLNHRYEYQGHLKQKIFSDIKNLFLNQTKKSVGIYKIPPEFNADINETTFTKCHYINYVKAYDDSFAYEIINYDIYFSLFLEMSKKENCTDINYILYDNTIPENIYASVDKLYPSFPSKITIWKVKNIESFNHFINADVFFIRGTYYNFFNNLIPKTAKVIFYPATSMKQTLTNDNNNNKFLLTKQKFNIVLEHEDSNYHKYYQSDKFVNFIKFASNNFVCYNGKERMYDLCFVATEKQLTKNHDLFLNFLLYMESIERKCNVIYIGNLEKILADNKMENILDKLNCVTLTNKEKCKQTDLIKIYNDTKINILFSGRDAFPRVITESAACGCFNIALDTLSDGKTFYDGHLGVLIGDNNVNKILKPFNSLSYVPDDKLWEKIIAYMDKNYDHNNISVLFKNKYSIDNNINEIYK